MSIRDWKLVRVLAGIAMRIWAASGAALLACFLLYCFYGGLFAFMLLMIAASGYSLFYFRPYIYYYVFFFSN